MHHPRQLRYLTEAILVCKCKLNVDKEYYTTCKLKNKSNWLNTIMTYQAIIIFSILSNFLDNT